MRFYQNTHAVILLSFRVTPHKSNFQNRTHVETVMDRHGNLKKGMQQRQSYSSVTNHRRVFICFTIKCDRRQKAPLKDPLSKCQNDSISIIVSNVSIDLFLTMNIKFGLKNQCCLDIKKTARLSITTGFDPIVEKCAPKHEWMRWKWQINACLLAKLECENGEKECDSRWSKVASEWIIFCHENMFVTHFIFVNVFALTPLHTPQFYWLHSVWNCSVLCLFFFRCRAIFSEYFKLCRTHERNRCSVYKMCHLSQ